MDPRHQAPSRPENKSLNSYLICRNFTFVRRVFGDKLTESEKTSADLNDTNFCFYQALSYKVRVNGKRSLVTRLNWSQGRNAAKVKTRVQTLKSLLFFPSPVSFSRVSSPPPRPPSSLPPLFALSTQASDSNTSKLFKMAEIQHEQNPLR